MRSLLAAALWCVGTTAAFAVDTIFVNGKIVTVDDRFSIAQAVAVRGDRIAAVGANDKVRALATPSTRVIDLQGRTVVPGLIDTHIHFIRAASYWSKEARLDLVRSRKQALEMLAAKAKAGVADLLDPAMLCRLNTFCPARGPIAMRYVHEAACSAVSAGSAPTPSVRSCR